MEKFKPKQKKSDLWCRNKEINDAIKKYFGRRYYENMEG